MIMIKIIGIKYIVCSCFSDVYIFGMLFAKLIIETNNFRS